MRWALAGCSFALLLALAVFTVAIRSANVRSRAWLERLTRDVHARQVELARRQFEVRMATARPALALRCRALIGEEAVAE